MYISMESRTIPFTNGSSYTPRSWAVRNRFQQGTGSTASTWFEESQQLISIDEGVRWSFFNRGRSTNVYFSTTSNGIIVLNFAQSPATTSRLNFTPQPAGSVLRAAHLPPIVSGVEHHVIISSKFACNLAR